VSAVLSSDLCDHGAIPIFPFGEFGSTGDCDRTRRAVARRMKELGSGESALDFARCGDHIVAVATAPTTAAFVPRNAVSEPSLPQFGRRDHGQNSSAESCDRVAVLSLSRLRSTLGSFWQRLRNLSAESQQTFQWGDVPQVPATVAA
jgi:hypothetical protein